MSPKGLGVRLKMMMRILFAIFIVGTFVSAVSGRRSDIREMKILLQNLFQSYSEEMGRLNHKLHASAEKFKQLERKTNRRYHKLESIINGSGSSEKHTRDNNGPATSERLTKLEHLSKTYAVRTCFELKSMGVVISGRYFLDPDGSASGHGPKDPPVEVYCDMTTGSTRIEHNLVGGTTVRNCQEPGCSVHRVEYNGITMKQIKFIMALSERCEQFIRFNCKGVPLNQYEAATNETIPQAWWTGERGEIHFYWHSDGGDDPLADGCACYPDGGCTEDKCFCDTGNSTAEWAADEGHLTSLDHLPVTQLNFAGTQGDKARAANFELGPLYCSGKKPVTNVAASCDDLFKVGGAETGYHVVKGQGVEFPQIVYCDMSLIPDDVGFERVYGSPGNLRPFAAFDVSMRHSFTDRYRYVNFTSANINTGGNKRESFNIKDGIFHVPETGVYLLSVHALPMKGKPCRLQIHHNGNPVADLSNGRKGNSMIGQSVLLEAAQGDQVRLYNNGGDIEENGETRSSYLHFIGMLIQSSDRT